MPITVKKAEPERPQDKSYFPWSMTARMPFCGQNNLNHHHKFMFTEIEDQPITKNGYQGGRPTPMAENIYNQCANPVDRFEAFKRYFPQMMAEAYRMQRSQVVNENSFAAGITTNFLINGAITKLGPRLAPFRAFAKSSDVDPYKPLATGIQKFNVTVQDGSDTQTNATDFTASSDSTLNGPNITVAQYTQGLHLTNAQLNSGIRMADLIEAKLGSFKTKLIQVATAPMTTTNFAVGVTQSGVAFGFSDMATLQGLLQKANKKNLILNGTYLARISNQPGFFQKTGTLGGMDNAWEAYGWDLICLNSEWSGVANNVQGFACMPQAIGMIAGLPVDPPIPGNILQTGEAILEGAGIGIKTYLWMDANARTLRASYDIVLGVAAVDTTAGYLITSS